ncbi:MAG: hypothetical protein HZB46_16020 [Solirubrobacterales bacterium]|nr:hypothetical protein [Solirubrobacterales bacterium]
MQLIHPALAATAAAIALAVPGTAAASSPAGTTTAPKGPQPSGYSWGVSQAGGYAFMDYTDDV